MNLKKKMTNGQLYGPAMCVKDQAAADEYFEALVERRVKFFNMERKDAEELEKMNIGYFAGCCKNETALRVFRLFNCTHPVFGEKYPPTKEEIQRAAEALVGWHALFEEPCA